MNKDRYSERFTHDDLLAAVTYNQETGEFHRKKAAGNRAAGSKIGSHCNKGYLTAMVLGKYVRLHRLAWFYVHGVWPSEIDHINQIKDDNRIANLRECTTAQNCLNQTGPRANNSLGVQGVHVIKKTGRFRATLRGRHIGCYATPEEAHKAYTHAKEEALHES